MKEREKEKRGVSAKRTKRTTHLHPGCRAMSSTAYFEGDRQEAVRLSIVSGGGAGRYSAVSAVE
jgi:hypothetical protein